ncbi:MAG: small multi-drug export protein [Clostridiales bacterium]|nr:small multi-drug export protein [Clostridiales bacterium]
MGEKLPHFLWIIMLAMAPVAELRWAIPVAIGYDFPPLAAFGLSVVGNMLPIPFIFLFIRPIFRWLRRLPRLHGPIERLEAKARHKSARVSRYRFWGLALFVAIPLPGTGAWTGAMIASFLDMRLKHAMPAIFIGVLIAGLLVTALSTGVFAGVEWLKELFMLRQ